MWRTIQETNHSKVFQFVLPIGAGAVIACIVTLTLFALKPVWVVLFIIGLICALPSFVVKDSELYWIALFLFLLPFDISKNLIDSSKILETLRIHEPGGINSVQLRLTDLPLLVLLVKWCLRLTHGKEQIYFPKASYLAIGYIGWAALSSLMGAHIYLSIVDLVRECKFFLIYLYTANNIRSKHAIRVLMLVLLFWLLAQGTITLLRYEFQYFDPIFGEQMGEADPSVQPITESSSVLERIRGFGTINSPSETATHFEYLLPLAFILSLCSSNIKAKIISLILFVLGIGGLYVTFSRAAAMGLISGIVACLIVTYRSRLVSKTVIFISLYAFIALGLVLSPALYSYMETRPENIPNRMLQYQAPIRMIQSHPIFGVGLNNSSTLKGAYVPETADLGIVHSLYLVIASETGVIGLVLFAGFFTLIGRKALYCSRSPNLDIALFSTAIFGTIISLAVHLSVDLFYRDPLLTLLWFYGGLIMAFTRIEEKQRILQQ